MSDPANGSAGDLKRWQRRIFWSVWITYFAYYLVPLQHADGEDDVVRDVLVGRRDSSACVFTSLTAMYAFGQFVNGQLADRFGSRRIASLGVFGSVVMNLAVFVLLLVAPPGVGRSQASCSWLLVVFWGVNGFFQAMGWSPMVRVMAHWYPTSRRGKVMGMMGTCYQFGERLHVAVGLLPGRLLRAGSWAATGGACSSCRR